jgi:hypothetical protein
MVFVLIFVAVACLGSERRLHLGGEVMRPEEVLPPVVGNEIVPSSGARTSPAEGFLQSYTSDTVGSSTYDWQYNSCALSRIVFDSTNGMVHVCWTWSDVDDPYADRNVYYNAWDPVGVQWVAGEGMDAGYPVQTERGGYATMGVTSTGCAVVALHRSTGGALSRSSVGIDIFPGLGVFEMHDVPNTPTYIIWPRVAVDGSDNMVVVSRDANEGEDDCYYTVSSDGGVTWTPWTFLDSINSVSQNAFASKQSETMAIMWSKELQVDDFAGHIFYQTSTDGGASWGRPRDATLSIDPVAGHTYRWWEMRCNNFGGSGIMDENDEVNLAFTTTMGVGESGFYYPWMPAVIWFYNADLGVSPITLYPAYWSSGWGADPFGNTQLADKPALGLDPATGYFYCVWIEFPYDHNDPVTAFPIGDLFAARSMDGGATWGPKVNLTNTSDLSEVFPCFASVVNGSLHIFYEWDLESGSHIHGHSSLTDNPFNYLNVPVVEGDVEVVSIDDPPHWGMTPDTTTYSDMTYVPKATFRNAGAAPVSFQAKFDIATPVYFSGVGAGDLDTLLIPASLQYGIVEVTDLGAGQSIQVQFPAWTCSTWMSDYWAQYTVSACLLGDTDVSGNVLLDSALVDSKPVGVEEVPVVTHRSPLSLAQSYPNPMVAAAVIAFQIPESDAISLSVYDCNGRLVKNLADGYREKGSYEVIWDGRNSVGERVSSGVYFYRLMTSYGSRTEKLSLIN